jgi:hypothetical protein
MNNHGLEASVAHLPEILTFTLPLSYGVSLHIKKGGAYERAG